MELDATTILGTPVQYPERLPERVSSLLKKWHPDVSKHPRAQEVTSHLAEMLRVERDRSRAGPDSKPEGRWKSGGTVSFLGTDGKRRNVRYKKEHEFELGRFYYGNGVVAFDLDPTRVDLFNRAAVTLATLPYADQKMMDEMKRFLPAVASSFIGTDTRPVLVSEKPAGTYLLSDLMEARGGSIEPIHAAWIISGMLNVLCYLDFARIMHGDISTGTIFVCLSQHSVHLLGGWWYATGYGEIVDLIPSRTYRIAPYELKSKKEATGLVDRILVRETSFDMMRGRDIPDPMKDFLRMPPLESALEDYRTWKEEVLPASFGETRFARMDVSDREVFGE